MKVYFIYGRRPLYQGQYREGVFAVVLSIDGVVVHANGLQNLRIEELTVADEHDLAARLSTLPNPYPLSIGREVQVNANGGDHSGCFETGSTIPRVLAGEATTLELSF
jgi:hypothetical protein